MTNIEERLDRAANGEYRLNPDEQNLYLNTFRERVLLAVTFSDAQNLRLKSQFDNILSYFDGKYAKIFVKISGNLSDDLSAFYLKMAVKHQFEGQILTSDNADVYGIVIHTDMAVTLDKIGLTDVFPDIVLTAETPKIKKSFFGKLFG
ncbi:hypothetical protein Hs30E_06490 [Lactococcus hodotermopsidis]|uniref:DUF1694 domain-containing protein n=1 Tax=Pseudolactococcus hodotermopsidis TaxID=2709157 RepID=A0A6A0BCK7_9LACT|nr:DUF1694 domain-containing protein [Lactococcus hodotermopsidis]GFH42098.1 hypothetical protein Hs30E_06490 [Lactococcus hodotermopsidis]